MTAVAAVAAAALAWLLVPLAGDRVLADRLGGGAARARRGVGATRLTGLVVATVGTVALIGWGAGAGAVATSLGLVVVTAEKAVRGGRRTRAQGRRADEVARACDLIGSLVAIGHIPSAALDLAADDCPVLVPVASAQRVGAPVPAALRLAGSAPGANGLVRLAQAWEVGERTGAPLGQALAAVASAVRRDRDVDQVVAAELAGPRASGQVLAVLPGVGLAAGAALGGEPLSFFLTGVVGPVCLVAGVGLACLGVVWTDAMVGRASPGSARRRKGTA